ncbi:MAG: diaminopimelate epimerase [Planctomycetes bacterium]|nr:diaminopimelate epimerase [Planctomycetota bacterium]
MPFTKMHGIGNDYVYVDGHAHAVADPLALAREVADRHLGVGGDGLILILPPTAGSAAHVRMRMFNADGSEAEMCGNGVRCVCKYARDHGLCAEHPMRVETGGGVLELTYALDDDGLVSEVTVDMGAPRLEPALIPVRPPAGLRSGPTDAVVDVPLSAWGEIDLPARWDRDGGVEPRVTCVSMGNPHAILFAERVAAVPLEIVGPILERHAIFPERVNIHFVQVVSREEVLMRTWERGSGATRACGTGASAVCVAGRRTGRTARAVLAHLPGGDLRLRWDETTDHVFMTGPAVEVFQGSWPLTRKRAVCRGGGVSE